MTQPKKKPVAEIKSGLITASIWKNETSNGKTHYTVSFKRAYRAGEQWKRTASFGQGDLPGLAKLADLAYAKIDALSNSPASDSQPTE